MKRAELEEYIARLVPNAGFAALFRRHGLRYRWYALGTIMLANMAALLASTIINVAIPDIMGAFGIGQDDAQWISTANLASATVAMLASTWLVHRAGLRGTVLIAMVLFVTGAVAGALATNTGIMVVARILQGITSGLLTPLGMTIIFQVFPPGRQGFAMGVSSIGVILAPAIGPAVGGMLVDMFNWRYVFYPGIALACIALAAAATCLPARQDFRRVPFDLQGLLLLTASIVALLTGLSNGERQGWSSNFILACFATSVLSGGTFVRSQLRRPHPLIDPGVFLDRNFLIMSVNAFVFGAGLYASTYLIPLFLQLVQHLTPTVSGALMVVPGLVMLVIFPVAGRLAEFAEHRLLIGTGILFFAVSFWLMASADANTGFWTLVWWLTLSRIGIGLVMPALQMGALANVEPARMAAASGAFNFTRQLGGAYGVNLMSVVLERCTSVHADYLFSTQTFGNSDTLQVMGSLGGLASALGFAGTDQWNVALGFLRQIVQQQALAAGFRDSFTILALAFVATLLPTLALRPRSRRVALSQRQPVTA